MKRLRKRSSGHDVEVGGWLTTYSDLVTNLLCLFVLLFSFATVDDEKFEQLAKSLQSSFLEMSDGAMYLENNGQALVSLIADYNAVGAQSSVVRNSEVSEEDMALEDFKESVRQTISELQLDEYVSIIDETEEVTLRFNSLILFDSGSAEIKDSGKEVLKQLGDFLAKLDSEILIQGHTDNLPINTPMFPSNWELSTKRATNVVKFLIDNCGVDPAKITPTGNAEFRPVAPNDTEENRQKNRRIDIVVKK